MSRKITITLTHNNRLVVYAGQTVLALASIEELKEALPFLLTFPVLIQDSEGKPQSVVTFESNFPRKSDAA
jgi:hypothetical protein